MRTAELKSGLRNIVIVISIFFAAAPRILFSQNNDTKTIRMVFYNVENLFDLADDSIKNDDEFLPGGLRRWSSSRFTGKINSLYKVIVSAGVDEPPAFTGLCEVENRAVVHSLLTRTWLSKYDYGIIHEESGDPRGIDCAIIYRRDVLKPACSVYLVPQGYNRENFRSRGVLFTKFIAANDTLYVFLNHWPSRRGGTLPGEAVRLSLAKMVRHLADSLSEVTGGRAKIIIGGDFNCVPGDDEMVILTSDGSKQGNGIPGLINLAQPLSGRGEGTYKFRGIWEMLDQVLVSESLINDTAGLSLDMNSLSVFSPDFLLVRDESYPGMKPFPAYSGYRWTGGFSDHLPLVLDVSLRPSF
jgi:hypothetical protein